MFIDIPAQPTDLVCDKEELWNVLVALYSLKRLGL